MADLLGDVELLRAIARADLLGMIAEKQKNQRKRSDVTGHWDGYNADGSGRVIYMGKVYACRVLASTGKQKGGLVNLRRTANGNFVDWR
jgi:hypothetical protein